MTKQQLIELLKEVPDDIQILVPGEPKEGFTGVFFSPCIEDSGVIEMAGDENTTDEELDAYENHPVLVDIPIQKAFVLVPCGFYDEHDHTHELN